jgi:hypothetical protein
MTRQLARLVVVAVLVLSSRLAAADVVYDTVDAVQTRSNSSIVVTGIIAGQGTPTTTSYSLGLSSTSSGVDPAARCDRLVLLAMSKPGKFQLVMVSQSFQFDCKLVVRTP